MHSSSHNKGASSASSSVDDIWTMATDALAASGGDSADNENRTVNTHLIFFGDNSSGKSSLVQTFLKPSAGAAKDTKPTIALDYNYARKVANNIKYVAHIWELGGDLIEPRLLEIPLTKTTLFNATAVICCDLSKPHNVIPSLLRSLSALKEVVQKRAAEIQSTNSALLNDYREKLHAPIKAHADAARLRPLDIQTVILANKADALRSLPASERRGLLQMLRFVAHYFGAHIVCTSSSDSTTRELYRTLLNALCFGGTPRSMHELGDHSDRALALSRGTDRFEAILLEGLDSQQPAHRMVQGPQEVEHYLTHKGVTRDVWQRLTAKSAELFGEAEALPSQSLHDRADELDTADNNNNNSSNNHNPFPETEIDDMRAARDAQLERFVQEQERRKEMLAKMAANR